MPAVKRWPRYYLHRALARQANAPLAPGTKDPVADADEVVEFAKNIGMVPIELKKEKAGYVLNSLLVPLLNAASDLLIDGIADPDMVDKTWRIGTGAPFGPFQIMDVVGLTTVYNISSQGGEKQREFADYIKKTFNLAIGDKTAEDIKINIGSAVPLEEELSMTIKGRDFVAGLPRSITVSTNEIVKAIDKELREMVKAIKDVLQETPPELSADIIDQGIIMTGGSSMLRNLPELVFRRTGVKAILADDALYCVVKGTGVALEHLDTYRKSIIAKR